MILKHRETGTTEFVLERESDETPYVMGSWNDWRFPGIPMVRQEGERSRWSVIVPLPPGEHKFRYRISDSWFNNSAADRYVDNGLGGENSVVIVEEVATKTSGSPRRRSAAGRPVRSPRERTPKS